MLDENFLAFDITSFTFFEIVKHYQNIPCSMCRQQQFFLPRFFMAGKERANHNHGRTEVYGLSNIAVSSNPGLSAIIGFVAQPLRHQLRANLTANPYTVPVFSLVIQTLPDQYRPWLHQQFAFSSSRTASGVPTLPAITKLSGIIWYDVSCQ